MNRAFRVGRRGRRLALVTGIIAAVLVGLALPAWAHHPVLSGDTECTNGNHVITWTIGNNQPDQAMTIVSATANIGNTHYAVTGYTTPVGNGGETSATTVVPGPVTGTVTLTIDVTWPDEFEKTDSTEVDLEDTCVSPPTTSTSTTEVQGATTLFTTTTTPITGQGGTAPTVVNQATTTSQPASDTLPRTGSSSGYALFFGLSCVAGGALLLIGRRRNWAGK